MTSKCTYSKLCYGDDVHEPDQVKINRWKS